ncbi:hypothetical protein SDRG_03002 [Saprolegnia diclina VS20]|uniref:EF-hand domain-containing protein n=1 Tax=Saprolegnia diclina (strain VS20) TaxID=1156394 RepID=T0S9W7_SAPDV|nr:hypothetical protein SDRG_03002 [Saprolegnia diclina VS20]EQC39567.1 hypothetical protein SDRG_03002 [Saprolegnia diclina VS20]|eukprot:XP_008606839.1 hypothetical protein SDRG_03002 [Saprolegnia diclina VS20]
MSSTLERQQLEEASRSLHTAIEKSQQLQKLARISPHYRDVAIDDARLHEASCIVALASVKRLLSAFAADPAKRVAAMAEVDVLLTTADGVYDDIRVVRPDECKRGHGNALHERGAIYFHAADFTRAEEAWTTSCQCFEALGDASAASELLKKLEKLRHERDVNAYAQQLVERTTENHERDALLKAFATFDRDHSGEIDTAEFAALSVELGTFPALSPDEVKEAFAQLDTSANQKISFGEFWTWWCTDEVQAYAQKHKAQRK